MVGPARVGLGFVLVAAMLALVTGCSDPGSSDRSNAARTTRATAAGSSTEPRSARTSTGCGAQPPVAATSEPPGDVPLTFAPNGRTYRLGVPAEYDPHEPTPLILDLHGSGSNAGQQSAYSQLPKRGTERGYLVVTPDAIHGRWELAGRGRDDEFLTALLVDIERTYCVDLDRVHAAGISLGAWKATITACTHPDRFASIGLVAEEVAPPGCSMPVVAFRGTADAVVPYGAGADEGVVVQGANVGLTGVEVNMPAWARNAGCSEDKVVERIEPDVEHWTYRGCPEGAGVELYSVEHGGHTWPGSPIELPKTTQTIDATEIILDWFDDHPQR